MDNLNNSLLARSDNANQIVVERTQSTYSNDLAKEPPIHTLSTDILEYIFSLNATDLGVFPSNRTAAAATTMASSQVCTRWRSTALNYPAIWGHIISYDRLSLSWIDELLRRSAPSLLDFGSRVGCIILTDRPHDSLVLELVLNNTSRLRVFSLQAPTACWEPVRTRFLQQPAPNLEFMMFCLPSNSGLVLNASNLFSNHAPCLRNLHLSRCAVGFPSSTLMPLTELYIHHTTALNASPTVMSWLCILGEMSSLRWLTIIDSISTDRRNEIGFPTIHLAKLEMLRVAGALHESVTLINQLIMPPHCGLKLNCKHARMGVEQRMLWTIIEGRLNSWETDTPGRYLIANHREHSIAFGNDPYIGIQWEVTAAEFMYYKRKLPPDPVLAIALNSENSEDVTPLFLSLFALFDHTFMTTTYLTLWVEYEPPNGAEVFFPLVDRFRFFLNLESLDLLGGSHSFLLSILQHVSPSSSESVLLPALRALHFLQGHFRRDSESVAHIASFLRWRKERGLPIHTVDILESRIDREFVLSELRDVTVHMSSWNDSDPDNDEDYIG